MSGVPQSESGNSKGSSHAEGIGSPPPGSIRLWAKTKADGDPGISVEGHCQNVGCVAELLLQNLPERVKNLLPGGCATLAALHDVGKATLGFQAKCARWLRPAGLEHLAREAAYSVSDHALVSQVFLQKLLKLSGSALWAAAVGAHHGRPKGRDARLGGAETLGEWAEQERQRITTRMEECFGGLPTRGPRRDLEPACSDLWLLAGLITMADWIGSNEDFFASDRDVSLPESRKAAEDSLRRIGWPGGKLKAQGFRESFGFDPNLLQRTLLGAAQEPGLIIVEGPMGCGKTEAALGAAQQLISAGHHQGIYFALPTQVTSNRIHLRVTRFLEKTLDGEAHLRLAHAHAWLQEDFTLRLSAAWQADSRREKEDPQEEAREARSWFASAKQALLAPYGVGTVDQALQGMVTIKHFFLRRFALAGKVVILDEVHSYDVYTGALITSLIRELLTLGCTVVVLSATLTTARRQELLQVAGCAEAISPTAYPLVTCAIPGKPVIHHTTGSEATRKTVALRCENVSESEVIAELVSRASHGQNVLWLRNTVVEAQQSFREVRSALSEGHVETGLMHSRFPHSRRAELEEFWLAKLGRERPGSANGSILVATQVVEQSVDIDLDFMVSDLAPTDMLLQRMGRLWRHQQPHRCADKPEFWIRLPEISESLNAAELSRALGRSGKVYAPYVLLRSARVFAGRGALVLPDDIRPVLEATYGEASEPEPPAWETLKQALEAEKEQLQRNAQAAMLVFGRPMIDPESDGALTRRKGQPTTPLVLLRSAERGTVAGEWHLTALDGCTQTVSEYEWRLSAARFLHVWLVRVPRWMIPPGLSTPEWLSLHAGRGTFFAVLQEDGVLEFQGERSRVSYHPDLGVYVEKQPQITTYAEDWNELDDEFDC